MSELIRRRASTAERFSNLRASLTDSAVRLTDVACVYATGSFGRGEAGSHSDLDLFIVGLSTNDSGVERPRLKRLDEICIKADLIRQTESMGIPEFDGDGKYLQHYSVEQLTRSLGASDDDANNTFTARLLLLLESSPLLGGNIYNDIMQKVIESYWRDYEGHEVDFVPAFLVNDILRLWRTFCVNYEARTEREPNEKKIKRKIKNYKLKYSRLMTCYSALLWLLSEYRRNGVVSPENVVSMSRMAPTARVEKLRDEADSPLEVDVLRKMLDSYEQFLLDTSVPEKDLIERFSREPDAIQLVKKANGFGDIVFKAVTTIGAESRLHRIIVV